MLNHDFFAIWCVTQKQADLPHCNTLSPEEVLKALGIVNMAAAHCHTLVVRNDTRVSTAAIDQWQVHLNLWEGTAHTISIQHRETGSCPQQDWFN